MQDQINISDYAIPPAEIDASNARKESYEEHVSKGTVLRELQDNSQWAMGDLAYKVSKDLGNEPNNAVDKRTPLDQLALDIGERPGTLRQYKWVSTKFPDRGSRKTNLSWSHYRYAAGTDEPLVWIDKAVNDNLTSTQLKELILQHQDRLSEVYKTPCSFCSDPLPEDGALHVRRAHKKTSFCSIGCLLGFWLATQKEESNKV